MVKKIEDWACLSRDTEAKITQNKHLEIKSMSADGKVVERN